MGNPLEGIRILDMTDMIAGPLVSMYLADQGADVIKVERLGGETSRVMDAGTGVGRTVLVSERNKKSIVVDIASSDGKQIVRCLLEKCDVVVAAFRPASAKQLGLDYGTVSKINPRIIYACLTGYGSKGPLSEMPGYDRQVVALTGLMTVRRMPDGSPILPPTLIADHSAPILLAYGIVLALMDREKTGKGQKVETSLLAAAIAMQATDLVLVENDEKVDRSKAALQAVWAPYRCQDGRYIMTSVGTNEHWAKLCKVLDLEHLIRDSRYDSWKGRAEHSDELYPLLEGVYATKTAQEWLDLLWREDLPSAVVTARSEVFNHPQALDNELIIEINDQTSGKTKMMGILVKLADSPAKIRTCAPKAGQHTNELLLELGYNRFDIERLRNNKVIQ